MRKICVMTLFLITTLLLAGSYQIVVESQTSDSWPQFRGNLLNTGVSPTTVIGGDSEGGTGNGPGILKVLWSYDAGDVIESSAAIANGVSYVGSGKGELLALDLWSGKLKWKYVTTEPIGESSPAVGGGMVFIGDLVGVFHAVNAADGRGVWSYKTGGEIKSSPVIVGDRVLIGSYDGYLYCFQLRDGKTLWRFHTDNFVHGTPAVVDGVAWFAGCDEIFHGIRIADGKEVVSMPAGGNTAASAAFDGQLAFFGNFNNEVVALDLKTKRRKWLYTNPTRQFPFYSSPAVFGGRVVLGGRDKMVHCIDAATGRMIWTFATRARVESSPVIAGGQVYIGSNDGRLYVLDLAKGTKIWEYNAGGAISASPAIAAGRVVIGDQQGRIYCFGR
jgi:eukaryotic-like serine/threonine-protein kinase